MEGDGDERGGSGCFGTVIGLFALVAMAIGSYLLLYPSAVPSASGSGFADNVFASAPVVFAGRLVVLSAAVVLAIGAAYVVASIGSLWSRGQWFTRFGPFEISSEAIGDLVDEADAWRDRALNDAAEVMALRRRLADSEQETRYVLSLLPDDVRRRIASSSAPRDSGVGDA